MMILERSLVVICRIFFFLCWILQKTLEVAAKVIEFLLFVAFLGFGVSTIRGLSADWQSLVLTSIIWAFAIFGISFFALAFWKPEKLGDIMGKYKW